MLLRDRILVSLVMLAALVAAGRTTLRYLERKQASLDYGSVAARSVPGRILNARPEIGRASFLSVTGNRVLVGARRSDSALYVVSAETGELTGSAGAKGDGRRQFRAPAAVVPTTDDSGGRWLFDVALRRLTRVRLQDGTPRIDTSTSAVVQLPPEMVLFDPVWLEDGTLLATGLFSEGRFGIFDRTGAVVGFVGSLPPNPRGDSTEAIRVVYMGKLRAAPDRPRLAVSAPYAGRLDIYRAHDWQALSADVPFPFEPQYAVVEGSRGLTFAPTRNTRYGYIDLAVTKQHVFGLFSGRTEISHPGRDNYAEYVHVFDWEGAFLDAYHLDEDLFVIAVDEEGRRLYGARHLPEPAILLYELDAVR
jgi:hypothetical protein